MSIEVACPQSRVEWLKLRESTLGASESPAMLGASPWQTPYGLWAAKSGLAPPVEQTLVMRLGNHDEAFILELAQEERPDWAITPNAIGAGGRFYRDAEAGLSATPDALVGKEDSSLGVCQAKRVSAYQFRENWRDDFGDAAVPPYIAIQVIQEAMLTGATWGCVAALVVGDFNSEFHLLEVPIHAGIAARIRIAAKDFWRRVREKDPYPHDFAKDNDVIKYIYADENGGTIDLSSNERAKKLVARRESLKLIESAAGAAEKERKLIDIELIAALGNAARGMLGDGRFVEALTVKRKGFSVEPKQFRNIKICEARGTIDGRTIEAR